MITSQITEEEAAFASQLMAISRNESLSKETRQIAICEMIENTLESVYFKRGYESGHADSILEKKQPSDPVLRKFEEAIYQIHSILSEVKLTNSTEEQILDICKSATLIYKHPKP